MIETMVGSDVHEAVIKLPCYKLLAFKQLSKRYLLDFILSAYGPANMSS